MSPRFVSSAHGPGAIAATALQLQREAAQVTTRHPPVPMMEGFEFPPALPTRGDVVCVRIGGVSKRELLAHLAEVPVMLNPMAEQLFADERFTVGAESSLVEVVTATVEDLGFRAGATFSQLLDEASRHGLVPCPLELAVHLRLQFTDQDEGSLGLPLTRHQAPPRSLTMVSSPPGGDDDLPWGFYLRRIDGVLWLRGYRSWPGHVWSPGDRLGFMRAQHAA